MQRLIPTENFLLFSCASAQWTARTTKGSYEVLFAPFSSLADSADALGSSVVGGTMPKRSPNTWWTVKKSKREREEAEQLWQVNEWEEPKRKAAKLEQANRDRLSASLMAGIKGSALSGFLQRPKCRRQIYPNLRVRGCLTSYRFPDYEQFAKQLLRAIAQLVFESRMLSCISHRRV